MRLAATATVAIVVVFGCGGDDTGGGASDDTPGQAACEPAAHFGRRTVVPFDCLQPEFQAIDREPDGDFDFACVTSNDRVQWYVNDGRESFAEEEPLDDATIVALERGGAYSVGMADFDGDGDPDWATREGLRRNDGTGVFGVAEPWPMLDGATFPFRPDTEIRTSFADVDRDGDLDVLSFVFSQTSAPILALAENRGDGSFDARAVSRPDSGHCVGLGESSDVPGFAVFCGTCDAAPYGMCLFSLGEASLDLAAVGEDRGANYVGRLVAAEDLDRDGSLELLIVEGALVRIGAIVDGAIQVVADLVEGETYVGGATLVDADCDGHLDVAAVAANDSPADPREIVMLRNDGHGAFSEVARTSIQEETFSEYVLRGALDFDADDIPDLWATTRSSSSGVWALEIRFGAPEPSNESN